jgi:hypothetical protein
MTAAAQAKPSRAEINRNNARKSTGPRSASGKSKVRFNALKHGLRAKTQVLPGEDQATFDQRLRSWTIALDARDEVEQFMVCRAVEASWKAERAGRALDAKRRALCLGDGDRLARQAEEVVALGRRLFFDPFGPLCLYPHAAPAGGEPQRLSYSDDPEDPDDPARIVVRLEAMTLGCAWLLDRWGELREVLEDGLLWQPQDRLKAVRMLGRQPLDAVDDKRVMAIYLSCWAMDPADQFGFSDQRSELTAKERIEYVERLNGREPLESKPASPEEARAALWALIVEEEERLEGILARHLEREEAELQAVLAFDDSAWSERLRRYESENDRTLLRIIETLRKRHREADGTTSPGRQADLAPRMRASAPAEAPPQGPTDPPSMPAEEAAEQATDSPGSWDSGEVDVEDPARGPSPARAQAPSQETAIEDEWVVRELTEEELQVRRARIAEVLGLSPVSPAGDVGNEGPSEVPGPGPARTEPCPAGDPDRRSDGLAPVAAAGIEVQASGDKGSRNSASEADRPAAAARLLAGAVLALFALLFLGGFAAAFARSSVVPPTANSDWPTGPNLDPVPNHAPRFDPWLCSLRAPAEGGFPASKRKEGRMPVPIVTPIASLCATVRISA